MKWYHRIGVKFVDLVILAIALVYITTSATRLGLALFSFDFFTLLLIVIVVYMGVVIFTKIIMTALQAGEGRCAQVVKTAIAGWLIFTTFPTVLGWVMFFFGYRLTSDAQIILMVVSIVRTCIAVYLGRLWEEAPI